MTAKKKEQFRQLGSEYFESERELVSQGVYEAGPVKTKWLMPVCLIMCVATFWSVSRLTGYIQPGEDYTMIFVAFASSLIVGISVYNLITYLIIKLVAKPPKEKLCMYRRFLRFECGCKDILRKNDYFCAEIVPFAIFVVVPIVLEFFFTSGWFLCYGIVTCTCQMMNVYYLIQIGAADEKALVGIIPGSGELRIYREKSKVKRPRNR